MNPILQALAMSAAMGWEILWPLILGFALSAVIQAVVRREAVARRMSGDSPRALAWATGLGAASSSCSYAAVALARSLFRKGASLTSAMAFEIASTNLVIELGVILWLLMGWQFTLAEFVGGPLMIIVMAILFRFWMRGRVLDAAREQADKGVLGSMEGHAAMDMSVQGSESFWRRLMSAKGFTAVSHFYVMDWASVLRDILIGLLIAGAVAAWIPAEWMQAFFLTDDPTRAAIWGPIIGPVVAVLSFVCSIGNVPLAAVLWNGGISFGGVVSFIFADLIVVPIILIYRKYYGWNAALRITGIFYVAMVIAGYVIEFLFGALDLAPSQRSATVLEAGFDWNYTTWLNFGFIVLSGALVVRFLRTGGPEMLRMMSKPEAPMPETPGDHSHHDHG
jgi:uncharacterized membrane protein YraQ (UPF0718 family)